MNPAQRLAESLDREDYVAARNLLDDCRYEFRGSIIEGADAIIASYQGDGDKARDHFDQIDYESSIVAIDDATTRIEYTDIVAHASERLVHRCAQEIHADGEERVTLIRHIDYDGELETAEAFKQRHGYYDA